MIDPGFHPHGPKVSPLTKDNAKLGQRDFTRGKLIGNYQISRQVGHPRQYNLCSCFFQKGWIRNSSFGKKTCIVELVIVNCKFSRIFFLQIGFDSEDLKFTAFTTSKFTGFQPKLWSLQKDLLPPSKLSRFWFYSDWNMLEPSETSKSSKFKAGISFQPPRGCCQDGSCSYINQPGSWSDTCSQKSLVV